MGVMIYMDGRALSDAICQQAVCSSTYFRLRRTSSADESVVIQLMKVL